jgi:hypothetical protein
MVGAALVAAGCSDGAAPAGSARCLAAASLPLTARHVFGPPPSEDFTFDGDGYLLALDSGRSLVRVARETVPVLVAPNGGANGRGLRVLAGGDVVIADQDRSLLVRVDTAGNPRRLTTTIANPNGLALGPGGTLWATDFGVTGDVHRVDADSGEATALARPAKGSNGLVFSPDYRVLYVGDHDAGVIYRLPLLPDGRLGAAERWAEGLGQPDGLAVDACGNVYVASWDRRVYQVNPAGEVRVLAELTSTVSAVAFGSGKHGWKADSLYAAALQAGGVFELDVGQSAPTEQAPPSPATCLAPPPADSVPAASVPHRRCPLERKVGEFLVEMGERYTAVSGGIAEAPVPADVREVIAEAGGCRLLRRRQLACFPACGAGMTCGDGGRCLRYPENLDAGTVEVKGLRCQVQMRPDPTARRYSNTTLPHPGYTPGASIHLAATGADVPAFSLVGWGVAALALDEAPLQLQPDQALRVSWQVAGPGPARVQLDVDVDQHGITPVTLSCDVADSGSFEVPADLVARLLAAGVSGYPRLRASRQTVDSRDLPPGCVELVVASARERSLQVVGHTPCRSDTDCPAPRRCNVASQNCL